MDAINLAALCFAILTSSQLSYPDIRSGITNIIVPINNLLVQAPVVKLNYFFTISALPQSVTTIAI
jgi:hypothetical protein